MTNSQDDMKWNYSDFLHMDVAVARNVPHVWLRVCKQLSESMAPMAVFLCHANKLGGLVKCNCLTID